MRVLKEKGQFEYLCYMVTVEQLIANLLLRHNCVIIPSFGGFVAKRVAAKIDFEKGMMLPPGKSILFNRQLLNNDGLLIHEYSRENSVSYEEASTVLTDLVKDWNTTLHSGGRIEIEQVGNLFFDEDRNICFEQDRFCNLLLESFGLGSVHFVSEEDVKIVEQTLAKSTKEEPTKVTAQQEETKEPAIVVEEALIIPIATAEKPVVEEKTNQEAEPKPKRRAWRYVAAACLLPIAFYSVWIPVKTDILESGVISFHDFNPFHKQTAPSYEPLESTKQIELSEKEADVSLDEEIKDVPEDVKVYSYKLTDDTYIKVRLPEKEIVETQVEAVSPEPESTSANAFEPNSMHYIVGCFGDKTNADNLVAKLRANGLDAAIVDIRGGLHRVTAGAAISEEAYQTIKLKSDALGFSGWRLR